MRRSESNDGSPGKTTEMDMDKSKIEQRARAAFTDGAREHAFWEENAEWLKRDYPDQFVAVRDGKVIAAAPDLHEIVKQLADHRLRPSQVWLRFVQTTSRLLVL